MVSPGTTLPSLTTGLLTGAPQNRRHTCGALRIGVPDCIRVLLRTDNVTDAPTESSGTGTAKREEVRFLILSGLPHREVVLRDAVSGGTVSKIRQQLRAEMPLYRNTESGLSVPFACREKQSSRKKDTQPIEIIGGPGRIRISSQGLILERFSGDLPKLYQQRYQQS